jgi:hypothetical protein
MSGDMQFEGTPEEWDALVKKSRQKKLITEIMNEDAKDGLYKFDYSNTSLLKIKTGRSFLYRLWFLISAPIIWLIKGEIKIK